MTSFEETELRLGLPGGGDVQQAAAHTNNGKRGYEETIMDLKLKLSSDDDQQTKNHQKNNLYPGAGGNPPAKAQVVGWPPVRSYCKNILSVQKNNSLRRHQEAIGGGGAAFVKVSMDGAPYLRKVDLKMYKSYKDLSDGLGNMFSSSSCIGGLKKDLMNESNKLLLMDVLNNSDYVPTYEDKDGDWMLVGDVPWEMFVDSCKRLRIMKGKEAIGLAPKAMEKYKNRS